MDFKNIKNKINIYSKKAKTKLNEGINKGIKKIGDSNLTISNTKELEKIIDDTMNYENNYGKTSTKRTVVIFAEKQSDFYKKLFSYMLPIIYAKAWTQNIKIKLCDINIQKLEKYGVSASPSLIVFQNKKVIKIISGEEDIEKVVKNTNMDINELIDKS